MVKCKLTYLKGCGNSPHTMELEGKYINLWAMFSEYNKNSTCLSDLKIFIYYSIDSWCFINTFELSYNLYPRLYIRFDIFFSIEKILGSSRPTTDRTSRFFRRNDLLKTFSEREDGAGIRKLTNFASVYFESMEGRKFRLCAWFGHLTTASPISPHTTDGSLHIAKSMSNEMKSSVWCLNKMI